MNDICNGMYIVSYGKAYKIANTHTKRNELSYIRQFTRCFDVHGGEWSIIFNNIDEVLTEYSHNTPWKKAFPELFI